MQDREESTKDSKGHEIPRFKETYRQMKANARIVFTSVMMVRPVPGGDAGGALWRAAAAGLRPDRTGGGKTVVTDALGRTLELRSRRSASWRRAERCASR